MRRGAYSRIYGIALFLLTVIILTQSMFESSYICDLRKQLCCLTFSCYKIQQKKIRPDKACLSNTLHEMRVINKQLLDEVEHDIMNLLFNKL